MLYAAQAILLSENIEVYTHNGVSNQFQKFFIKTGKLPVDYGKAFSKILDQRMKSDYEIGFNASHDDAKHSFNEASGFVDVIRDYLS